MKGVLAKPHDVDAWGQKAALHASLLDQSERGEPEVAEYALRTARIQVL